MAGRALTPFRRSGREKTTIRCGTTSGWTRHFSLDEKPCDACCAAKAEYDHRRNTSGPTAIKNRQHAKSQQRALKRLKDAHPDEYRELYLAAKAEVLADPVTNPTG